MAHDQNFHNKIAQICLNCFKTLSKSGKPNEKEWTVLSCIVVEIEAKFSVVALGSGSKCIGRNKMSKNGDILNDSHAEVICRRAFLRYLYDQMKSNSSLLSFNEELKKYVVSGAAKFHFFTSHVPCGDAAIFLKQNPEDFGDVIVEEIEEVPSKKIKIDINRTGAKCLNEGDIQDPKLPGSDYHVLGVVRSKPGRGDPTSSVSCSDKLSKWCHLGIQGALLSLILDKPIYLSTFTILSSTIFCAEALNRALFYRLEDVCLEYPYAQNRLDIGTSTVPFEYVKIPERRACPSSIAWCDVKEKGFEVAVEGKRQGVTKKKLNTPLGQLKICKLELFKEFKAVCAKNNLSMLQNSELNSLTYGDVKKLANEYQNAWNMLRKSFKTWTVKDKNLLQFY